MSPRKYDRTRRDAAVEETRRRIVAATLELHAEQGIRATSWDEIAARAGVGVGTVYRHFPSLRELVPACGVVTFERLALPDAAAASRALAGARGRRARLRRLVQELFALYERGAAEIGNVRRERGDPELPMLVDAHRLVESSLDGLVAEALRPLGLARDAHAVTRALTDLAVWRSLREQGLTGERAVEVTVAALSGALRPR